MISKILLTLNVDEGATIFLSLTGFILGLFIAIIALCILLIVMQWKIFEKAGKPGWYAIIPVYNVWAMYEIVGMKGWYALTSIIPVIGPFCTAIFTIMLCIKLAKSFGKDTSFVFGLIFLSPIFYGILAFGKDSVYIGPNGQPMNQGYNQPMNQGYNQPMNQGYNQPMNQGYNQPMNQNYNQPMNQGYEQSMNQSYDQSMVQNNNQSMVQNDNQPMNQSYDQSMTQNNNQQFPNNGNM